MSRIGQKPSVVFPQSSHSGLAGETLHPCLESATIASHTPGAIILEAADLQPILRVLARRSHKDRGFDEW